jgi:hypothetical protein
MSQDPYTQNPYEDPPQQQPYEEPPAYSGPPTYEVPGPYDDPATYENMPERKPDEPPAHSLAGQGSYGQPQSPYGSQSGYGNGQSYDYAPPQPTPLPLGQAIRELPNQYWRVLTRPSSATMTDEMNKASWDIVWIQLIVFSIIEAILNYLTLQASPNLLNFPGISLTAADRQALMLVTSIVSIFIAPIVFFVIVGAFYLMARAFGGRGAFLPQSYTIALVHIPLSIISGLLVFIPVANLGTLLFFVLFVYRLVLYGNSVIAVHRLNRGKATLVVLIPVFVFFVLLMLCALSLIAAQ